MSITSITEHKNIGFYAKELNIGEQALRSAIENSTNVPIQEHIDIHIMCIAKKLLVLTKMSIEEISTHLSFNDRNRFTKLFRKHVGMTPTKFRGESLK